MDVAIRQQISKLRTFVDWAANQDDAPKGWIEIAYSPDDVRAIAARGHLAVVIGAEVDDLFRCGKLAHQKRTDPNVNACTQL